MKFLHAILSLICFALVSRSLAKPLSADLNSARLIPPPLGLSNVNCVMQCVQPVGKESDEEETVQVRGILSNYGTFYNCLKKCSTTGKKFLFLTKSTKE